MYNGISEKTPVDTGRARGNWQIGIGRDETSQLDRTGDASGEELPKVTSAKGDETIFISNNLPYINRLEYGWSDQAPSGMVGVTMAGIQTKIESIVGETK